MGRNRKTRHNLPTGPGATVRGLIGGAAFLIGIVILVTGLGSVVYIAFNSGFRGWHVPIALTLAGTALMVVTIVLISEPAPPREALKRKNTPVQ